MPLNSVTKKLQPKYLVANGAPLERQRKNPSTETDTHTASRATALTQRRKGHTHAKKWWRL